MAIQQELSLCLPFVPSIQTRGTRFPTSNRQTRQTWMTNIDVQAPFPSLTSQMDGNKPLSNVREHRGRSGRIGSGSCRSQASAFCVRRWIRSRMQGSGSLQGEGCEYRRHDLSARIYTGSHIRDVTMPVVDGTKIILVRGHCFWFLIQSNAGMRPYRYELTRKNGRTLGDPEPESETFTVTTLGHEGRCRRVVPPSRLIPTRCGLAQGSKPTFVPASYAFFYSQSTNLPVRRQ